MTIIKLKNLYKIYGDNADAYISKVKNGMNKQQLRQMHDHILALNNLTLDIVPKTVQVIIGLQESGKSTLINLLSKSIEPTDGGLFVQGTTANLNGKFNLFLNKTILENVMHEVEESKKLKAIELLDFFNLSEYQNKYPINLKKGFEQKVGLVRAYLKDPDILLLDECTQFVDKYIQEEILDAILKMQQKNKKTIVFISHNVKETIKIADRIAILEDGALEQEGTPKDILQNPKTKNIIGDLKSDYQQ